MSINNPLKISRLIAHRGASEFAPENTLAALRKASAMGAKWVEFDVRLTKDGVAVIFHDEKLKRITGRNGTIESTNYADLKKLDAGRWFDQSFSGEDIPTLAQWLDVAAELKMGINLEIKAKGKIAAQRLASSVSHVLKTHWHTSLPAPLISSFHSESLAALWPVSNANFGFNIYRWHPNFAKKLARFECVSLHVYYKSLNKERISAVKATGSKVFAYTVNDASMALKLFSMGVDAIFTNNPLLLSNQVLRKFKKE